jgi:hypothetical protein
MLQRNMRASEGRDRQRRFAMLAFLAGTAAIIVVSLALRVAIDELASRWAQGSPDLSRSLHES